MFSTLRRAKNSARKYLFGERGIWSKSGKKRQTYKNSQKFKNEQNEYRKQHPGIKSAEAMFLDPKLPTKRSHLGAFKNWIGLKLFGSRNTRTMSGKIKNWIESKLGLERSRNNAAREATALSAFTRGRLPSPTKRDAIKANLAQQLALTRPPIVAARRPHSSKK